MILLENCFDKLWNNAIDTNVPSTIRLVHKTQFKSDKQNLEKND